MYLEKYLYTVSHSKLIEVLSRTITICMIFPLIHKYMNQGVIEIGKFIETIIGVSQGGPQSPMLSNIMLNELIKNWTTAAINMCDTLMIT